MNAVGFCLVLFWQPIPQPLWSIDNALVEVTLWGLFASGWMLLFLGAFSINLFELLGLTQAAAWSAGSAVAPLKLKTAWIYRSLEHPMYVGVLLGLWMTPHMSVGHAILAAQLTIYIAVGMRYKSRDLKVRFGRSYQAWRERPTARNGAEARIEHDIVMAPLPPPIADLLARLASVEARSNQA